MRTPLRAVRLAPIVVAACLMAACSSSDSASMGVSTIKLSDASCSDVTSADVWISQVYWIGGNDSNNSRFVVSNTPQHYDLLDLQNGVTATLGSVTIPTGAYTQLRLIVDSGQVTLGNGLLFAGGSATSAVKVPSGAQTGIKVNFAGPVQITEGQNVLVVDFDVCRSFVFTGPAAAPTGVNFKPVLHATVADVAGSIAGTVSPASAHAMVYAIIAPDTLASATADTVTGNYVLRYLAPGTYTVAASGGGKQASASNIVVGNAQNVTGVNITLP